MSFWSKPLNWNSLFSQWKIKVNLSGYAYKLASHSRAETKRTPTGSPICLEVFLRALNAEVWRNGAFWVSISAADVVSLSLFLFFGLLMLQCDSMRVNNDLMQSIFCATGCMRLAFVSFLHPLVDNPLLGVRQTNTSGNGNALDASSSMANWISQKITFNLLWKFDR